MKHVSLKTVMIQLWMTLANKNTVTVVVKQKYERWNKQSDHLSCLTPAGPGIDAGVPATLARIERLQKMNK